MTSQDIQQVCQGYHQGVRCLQPIIPIDGSVIHPTCEATPQGGPVMPLAIAYRVNDALSDAGGDIDAATADLVKRAIPDGMKLFQASRLKARYEHTSFYADPPEPLARPAQGRADAIWEGRHHWTNAGVEDGRTVTQLDVNAAYLAAMNTWLPVGRLKPQQGDVFDRRRAGIYEITPPEWTLSTLPNPLGARREPGPMWVTRPTLQLLLDLAAREVCHAPVIHQSYTAPASESILKKFREVLRDARAAAIATEDAATLEYVKAMYSKIIATMGDSTSNREIRRPDWVHTIRAQAFANLWRRAARAAGAPGIEVYRVTGTDELHVVGPWREVFAEGTSLPQMKIKSTYRSGEQRVTRRR